MGSTQIRNKIPPRKTASPPITRLIESNELPVSRIEPANPSQAGPAHRKDRVCGAMAQQSGDGGGGNQSAPQKLLHLVGCREPKALTKRPGIAKR